VIEVVAGRGMSYKEKVWERRCWILVQAEEKKLYGGEGDDL
jgi:hypothetical protein